MLDREVRAKFKEFQGRTGKYEDLDINKVRFESRNVQKIFDSIRRGASPRPIKSFIVDSGFLGIKYNWLKIGDVTKSNIYLKETSQYINEKGKNKSVLGKKGDFLITNSMTVGIPIILDIDTCFHDGFLHLGFNDEKQQNYYNLYLYYYFTSYREKLILKSKDGIVKNLNIDIMKEVDVPIPKNLNEKYTSFKIQEAIVEFLENWKVRCTDVHRERASKKKPIYETIKKILVSNTFKGDEKLVENFNSFIKNRKYDLKFSDIEFETRPLHKVSDFPIMTRVSGGTDLTIDEYMSLNNDEKEKYFALVSATVENNQISGYVHKDRLQEKSLSRSNVITWTRINSDFFFLQKKPVCTNDDSFVMDVKSNFSVKFVRFSTIATMKKKKFHWGNKAGKNVVKELEILIPKQLKNYSSKEIQMFLVEFWEVITNEIDYQLDVCDKSIELADKIDQAFLYRTFSKIDWSGE